MAQNTSGQFALPHTKTQKTAQVAKNDKSRKIKKTNFLKKQISILPQLEPRPWGDEYKSTPQSVGGGGIHTKMFKKEDILL